MGTRGSDLALAQAKLVLKLLGRATYEGDRLKFVLRTLRTTGDDLFRKPNVKLTGKDTFTGAIDRALLRGEIDIAVHSLKDVPVEKFGNDGKIVLAAFPKRESPFDAFVCRGAKMPLRELPRGARLGTSSTRRAVQLRAFRPDLIVVKIHGNVPTRIKKMRDNPVGEGGIDGIVLAEAGLNRLGLRKEIAEVLPTRLMLPAVGQGCLAVALRSDDKALIAVASSIDDERTRVAVTAERAFSAELGGGCNLPIAALATVVATPTRKTHRRSTLALEGLVARGSKGEGMIVKDRISGDYDEPELLGKSLAKKFKSFGSS